MKNYENGRIIVAFAVVVVIVVGTAAAAAVAADTHTQYINDKMSQTQTRRSENIREWKIKKKYHPLFDWCELSTAWIFVYVCDAFERQRGTKKK